MNKCVLLFFSALLFSQLSLCQDNITNEKEGTISTGFGFANATKNTKSSGTDFWIQLDYKLAAKFSIATEFENMGYTQPGYFSNLTPGLDNKIQYVINNFSLLVKYHFALHSKLQISVASGWTYSLREFSYYSVTVDSAATITISAIPYSLSVEDYRIPLIAEIAYPVSKKINVAARVKYNMNPPDGNDYSFGIGLSLKL
jgi:hypothetical protein